MGGTLYWDFPRLVAPVVRVAAPSTPAPFAPPMEDFYVPNAAVLIMDFTRDTRSRGSHAKMRMAVPNVERIADAVRRVVNGA
jgi:pyruvate/2-oxoglutarate/acetoin dehydrogenase E1 component